HTDIRALARAAEHPAGGRAVKIDSVADARVQGGNDQRLAVGGETDVAYQPFIENLVDGIAVIDAALRLAHNTCALGRREGFGHCAPLLETWRGDGRF